MSAFPVQTTAGKGVLTGNEKISTSGVINTTNQKINNGNAVHRSTTATTGGVGNGVSADGIDTFQIQLDLDLGSRPNTSGEGHGENMDISQQGGDKSIPKK